jgi:hypothetical protein
MSSSCNADPNIGHPPSATREVSWPRRLRPLFVFWLLAMPVGFVVAAAAAAAVWVFLPPRGQHVAYLTLQMFPPKPVGADPDPEADNDRNQAMQTELALLRSPAVLQAVFRDPKVQQLHLLHGVPLGVRLTDWLGGQIHIEFPNGPELPRVVLKGQDSEQLRVLATAIVDAYLSEVERQAIRERLTEIQSLFFEHEVTRNHFQELIGVADGKMAASQKARTTALLAATETESNTVRKELQIRAFLNPKVVAHVAVFKEQSKCLKDLENALDEGITALKRLNERQKTEPVVLRNDPDLHLARNALLGKANRLIGELRWSEKLAPPHLRKLVGTAVIVSDDRPLRLDAAIRAGLWAFAVVLFLASAMGLLRQSRSEF